MACLALTKIHVSMSVTTTRRQDISTTLHHVTISDDVKYNLIRNREPDPTFKFTARHYKDKRAKSGFLSIYCCRDWFKAFPFISHSRSADGLFCLACVLFPDSAHRRPKKLITEPYQNWKDALEDLKKHATCDYHMNSTAKNERICEDLRTSVH